MITLFLRCVPPSVTAQQKRLDVRGGRVRFFHGRRMTRQATTWQVLLAPHVPDQPIEGPLTLTMRLVYPHLVKTPKRDRPSLRPKLSKPDCSNVGKHLEDLLASMRFIVDDAQFVRTTVEKLHGPADRVGIHLEIDRWCAPDAH